MWRFMDLIIFPLSFNYRNKCHWNIIPSLKNIHLKFWKFEFNVNVLFWKHREIGVYCRKILITYLANCELTQKALLKNVSLPRGKQWVLCPKVLFKIAKFWVHLSNDFFFKSIRQSGQLDRRKSSYQLWYAAESRVLAT